MPGDWRDAAEALRRGLVVVVPTDTLYGLAALPEHEAKLFEVKRRPPEVQVPVLVTDREQAMTIAAALPEQLVERYWPGPLTVVVERRDRSGTVGLRVPDHDGLRELCAEVGPLSVTSANRHGEATPPTAAEVGALFGAEPLVGAVVDGGRCVGAASTVVDATTLHLKLLREGRLPWAEVISCG